MNEPPRRTIEGGPAPRDSIDRVVAGWAAARPRLDVAPVAVVARLARVNSLVRRELDAVFARHGLSAEDFALLATLVRVGERLSHARVTEELGIAPEQAASLSRRLDAAGLVRGGDGDSIEPTEQGLSVFEACAPEHLANEAEMLSALTEDERDALAILLRKLLVSLETGERG